MGKDAKTIAIFAVERKRQRGKGKESERRLHTKKKNKCVQHTKIKHAKQRPGNSLMTKDKRYRGTALFHSVTCRVSL